MPAAAGRIAIYTGDNALTDPIGGYTLTAVGTARYFSPGIVGSAMFGALTINDYFKSDALRASLSGATTWGVQGYFSTTASNLAAAPILLTLGSSAGDSIVLRLLNTGAVRTIVDDVLVTESAAGVVVPGRYHFAMTFGAGALKVYVSPASAISSTAVFSVTDARPAWPASGSVWLGVYGPNPGLVTAGQFLDEVGFFNTAPTTFPVLDTAPTLIAGTPTASTVPMTWIDDPWDSLGYLVYRSATNDSATASVVGRVAAGVQTFTDTGLADSTTFYYWLRPLKSCDLLGDFGVGISATTSAPPAPSTPTSLATTGPTAGTIGLTWTDGANTAWVPVYQSTTNNSATATLAEVAIAGAQAVTVYGLSSSTTYYFWLKAISSSGQESAFSTGASGTTTAPADLPTQPTALAATAQGHSRINLVWTDGAQTSLLAIERATDSGFSNSASVGFVGAGVQTFADTGLDASTQYWYRVRPYNSEGAGTTSASADATTAAAPSYTLSVADDVAYDFLVWLAANGLGAAQAPLFVNGELNTEAQSSGAFHLLLDFNDEAPADAVIISAPTDEETEPGVPVREARFECLIRATEDAATGSARNRAKACAKAVAEILRSTDQRNKTMMELPSGRVVHAFTEISYAPAGQDASGRFEYLLEFTVRYMDTLTQTN